MFLSRDAAASNHSLSTMSAYPVHSQKGQPLWQPHTKEHKLPHALSEWTFTLTAECGLSCWSGVTWAGACRVSEVVATCEVWPGSNSLTISKKDDMEKGSRLRLLVGAVRGWPHSLTPFYRVIWSKEYGLWHHIQLQKDAGSGGRQGRQPLEIPQVHMHMLSICHASFVLLQGLSAALLFVSLISAATHA